MQYMANIFRVLILSVYSIGLILERAYTQSAYFYKSIIPVGLFLGLFLIWKKSVLRNEVAFLFIIFVVAYAALSIGVLRYGFDVKYDAFSALLYIFSAYFLSRYLYVSQYDLLFYLLMYGSVIFLFAGAFVEYGYNQNYYDLLLYNRSRNVVSSWALCLGAINVVLIYVRTNKWYVWPLLISLFVSYVCATRMSLLLSFLLILIVAYYRFGYKFIFFVIPLISYVVFANYDLFFDLYSYTKFASSGLESERYFIWGKYIQNLDVFSSVFGLPLNAVDAIARFNVNPHNSFMKLHSYFGVAPFVFVFFLLFYKYDKLYKPFLLMLTIVVMRGFTDIIFWDGLMDIVFFAFMFALLYSESNNKNKSILSTLLPVK